LQVFDYLFQGIIHEHDISDDKVIDTCLMPCLSLPLNDGFNEKLYEYVDQFSPSGLNVQLVSLKQELAEISQNIANLGFKRRAVNLSPEQIKFLNDEFALQLCAGIRIHNNIAQTTLRGVRILERFGEEHKANLGSLKSRMLSQSLTEIKYTDLIWHVYLKRSFILSNIGCYAGVSPLSYEAAQVMEQIMDIIEGGAKDISLNDTNTSRSTGTLAS